MFAELIHLIIICLLCVLCACDPPVCILSTVLYFEKRSDVLIF